MELIPHVVFLLLLSIVESKKFGQLGPIVAHERNLHRDVCLGLWVNGVHNQGICILDVQNRMTCEEVNYLFRQQNHKYRPLPLEKVPKLVMKRALQEHALKNNKKTVLCANVDETFKSPENHCPPGFYPHRNQCYGVSTRKVHFPVAETICKQLGGQLANEFEDADVLVDLVKNYVQEDVFTGFNHVENLDNVEQTRSIEHAHVVVDYRAGELEYVVQNARRGFICQSRKRLLELPQPAMLPSYADDVKVHDLHPLQSEIKLDRHLVDLMSFHCYGAIDKNGNYKDYELAVTDLVENPPSGCTFKKSLGKVYVDIDNTHVLPSDLKHACKHLVPLYRVYDHVKARYFFLSGKLSKFWQIIYNSERFQLLPIGFCSSQRGDCEAEIPLRNENSTNVLCYLSNHTLDLRDEMNKNRPLRFMQVATRLSTIGTSYSNVVELKNSLLGANRKLEILGNTLDSLRYKELEHYCKQHLRPLYRLINKKNKKVVLTTDVEKVKESRLNRDTDYEEELLGYVANKKDYCGASLPLYHYAYSRPFHLQDVYSVRQKEKSSLVPLITKEIIGYLF